MIDILGDKDAKAPLTVTREEHVGSRTMGMRGEGLAQGIIKYRDEYDKENDQVHNVSSIVFRNCGEARAILHKHRAGRTIEDDGTKGEEDEIGDKIATRVAKRIAWMADGRSA